MKVARFSTEGIERYGLVEGEELREVEGGIFGDLRLTGKRYSLSQVKLLHPVQPRQIWCPGLNFASHLHVSASATGQSDLPEHPQPWHKGLNSIIGPEEYIVIPKASGGEVHYEGELVAVIGKVCRNVSPAEAAEYIFGYTCGNDISERDWQKNDNSYWRAKGSDTFCPVGPWIETELPAGGVDMVVRLNGDEVQRANTKDMLFDFGTVISCISQQVTLQPGDLLFSGTTGDTSAMRPGDIVEVEMEGIGVLRNPVKAQE